jgi:hypothetical protein
MNKQPSFFLFLREYDTPQNLFDVAVFLFSISEQFRVYTLGLYASGVDGHFFY